MLNNHLFLFFHPEITCIKNIADLVKICLLLLSFLGIGTLAAPGKVIYSQGSDKPTCCYGAEMMMRGVLELSKCESRPC